ncbi:SRPBCC family protein [Sphingoaurantiacus capsulatus]|uniref:SRPBCC family protein n=1 Tax=Sphingoaurantiacus capsulatus TaxID=1771310 RepID=A0ABV7X8T4_9SPHN
MSTTRLTRHVAAPPHRVYAALITPDDLVCWMVPDGMTMTVHHLDARVGGSFRISLTYDAPTDSGKSDAQTDSYHGQFVELIPAERMVQTMEFESDDPSMHGTMTATYTLTPTPDGGTHLVAVHADVPPGIRPEDNEAGWSESLGKLAALVEATTPRKRPR